MLENGFAEIVILMTLAVALVATFRRLHLPAILAYLVAGIIAGPSLSGLFTNADDMHLLAEIGIVFLLFSLGLEFSLPRLLAMRNLVFGAGMGQVLFTSVFFSAIAYAFSASIPAAIIIGGMLALSSTAIVIKQITELGIINQHRSQLAISILLFQDIAVVPLLIAVPLLGDGADTSIWFALVLALIKGVIVVAILLSAGKWGLPWLFREVARTRTDELFVLTTILVVLLAAGLTYIFGLSMALGAFLAGMMLGESQYKYQLEADIRPFRDILMGLFFITVGMQLDISVMLDHLALVIGGVIGIMVVKVVMVRAAAWIVNCDPQHAWSAGFKLCQIGEFSFVIAALAARHNVITQEQSSVLVSMGIISMAVTPYLVSRSLAFARKLAPSKHASQLEQPPCVTTQPQTGHVVIAGFGRVGQSVARLLKMEGVEFVVADVDPIRVHESRNAGEPVIFGDVAHKDILESAGVRTAKLLLISFDRPDVAVCVIDAARQLQPGLQVMVRTKRDYELDGLYAAGASQVVPELQEGSLMLISQVLHYSGVPMSRILKRVRQERKGRYDHLHGFYPGETTEISYGTEDKLEFIHAVALPGHAACLGQAINTLTLSRMRVSVKGLRRDGKEIKDPDGETALQAGDVLVIAGKPRRVERAERYLLEGG